MNISHSRVVQTDTSTDLFSKAFGRDPAHHSFAPGRIEFIGNHTDYNGGLVMGVAVSEGVTAAIGAKTDKRIALTSSSENQVSFDLDRIATATGKDSWANYPLGVLKVLKDKGISFNHGFEIAFTSTLPAGAGLSSSAAIELATAHALAALYGFELSKKEFAQVGRRAENEFVGMPCGLLDQGVSSFGKADTIVKIDCRDESFSHISMPKGADSSKRNNY